MTSTGFLGLSLLTLGLGAIPAPAQGTLSFSRLDANRDRAIERNEWRGNRTSFDRLDADRDGILTPEEYFFRGNASARDRRFRQWDRDLDGVISRPEWQSTPELFQQMDRDGDGVISQDEYREYDGSNTFNGRATFQQLDQNRDQAIEASEWRGTADQFRNLDQNGDGVLSPAEYFDRDSGIERQARFRSWDRNRDGRIEGNEWHSSPYLFHQLDRDGSSILDWNEFSQRAMNPYAGR